MGRTGLGRLVVGAAAIVLGAVVPAGVARAAPLAQAEATPTASPTPSAAPTASPLVVAPGTGSGSGSAGGSEAPPPAATPGAAAPPGGVSPPAAAAVPSTPAATAAPGPPAGAAVAAVAAGAASETAAGVAEAAPAASGGAADAALAAPSAIAGGAAPSPVAQGVDGAGRVLYADNFTSVTSGWPRESSDATTRRVGYADGEYVVARLAGSVGAPHVLRAERFGDFVLEIDARVVESTADAYVFVEFRRQDGGDHYAFIVAPDEHAFILRRHGEREGATLWDWTRTPLIQRGTASNRLGVRAQGDELVLSINGEEVARARADGPRDGGIGFGVGSLGDDAAEARFRNLVVTSVD